MLGNISVQITDDSIKAALKTLTEIQSDRFYYIGGVLGTVAIVKIVCDTIEKIESNKNQQLCLQ